MPKKNSVIRRNDEQVPNDGLTPEPAPALHRHDSGQSVRCRPVIRSSASGHSSARGAGALPLVITKSDSATIKLKYSNAACETDTEYVTRTRRV
ncbi:hypothetical protein EVAR_25462_1 [Eumeta japonica]|uniref:Uncharacterized protein n=1 Tax=Eumeta variegata TaxID=151549 RepID=A0A4C1VNB5_EUMVA|nr:hypothetical protein EVAR_25462_1 [Eumeta japonica]